MNIELRDYFAAKALPAAYNDLWEDVRARRILGVTEDWRMGVALEAYAMADAMLAAREVGKQKPDGDGWIEWHGGECPVDAGVAVEVKFHYTDRVYLSAQPTKLHWPHIAAYRVVQP